MGRSYSEYPFHEQQPMLGVQGSGPRLGNDEDKQKLGQQKAADLPEGKVTYRQPFAETVQRLQQKKAAKQAAAKSGTGRRAPAKKAAPAAKKATAKKTSAKKQAPAAKKPMVAKSAGRTSGATAKTPARGGKTMSRVAAAAKTVVQRAAKKVVGRGAKKR